VGSDRSRKEEWTRAKRLCRLSAADVRMARELGLNPRELVKNIPSPSQPWKAPVRVWVRELYRKRHGDSSRERPRSPGVRRTPPLPVAPAPDEPHEPEVEETAGADDESWTEPESSWDEEIAEEDRRLLRRQEELCAAAEFVAAAFAQLPFVERVVLFGSVAQPLRKEVPRFARFRRARLALWHECKDVDLAVWLSDVDDLKRLQKARARALSDLLSLAQIGVAHHQVDVFLFEPGTDRYRGRLCHFGTCPKGKPECRIPGCGAALFLRQHEAFMLDPRSLDPGRCTLLFDRAASFGPPSLERSEDDVPF
jgi:hypothetical protein